MTARNMFAAVGMLVISGWASMAGAQTACFNGQEAEAQRVKMLQSHLMVAALKCGGQPEHNSRGIYNSFVSRFTGALLHHSALLQKSFQRQYGDAYQQTLDRYITALANNASSYSNRVGDYCLTMAEAGRAVLETEQAELARTARELLVKLNQPVDVCITL